MLKKHHDDVYTMNEWTNDDFDPNYKSTEFIETIKTKPTKPSTKD